MPSHTHTQNAHTHVQDAHSHTERGASGGQDTDNFSVSKGSDSADNYAGDYSGSIGNTTAINQNTIAINQNTGGGAAHENRPPYYALAFIMKL
jgi:microcystin-dependent protein